MEVRWQEHLRPHAECWLVLLQSFESGDQWQVGHPLACLVGSVLRSSPLTLRDPFHHGHCRRPLPGSSQEAADSGDTDT